VRAYFQVFRANRKPIVILSGITLATIIGLFATKFSSPQNDKHPQTALNEPALTPHDELYSVHINSSGTGWVVGKFGRILRTPDGGRNWTQQNSGTGKPLTSVSFADDLRGLAVGGGGIIFATADGGQSWQPQNTGTKDHLLEVHVLSATSAFVAGAFGTLLSTRNGGVSWQKHSLAWNDLIPRLILETGQVEPHLNTVYFVDDKEGWLGGEFGLLLHTRDGGHTWIARRFGADFPQIVSLRFLDRRTGWAVGARGTVLNTNDGGKTWQEIDAGTKRDFYAVWIDGQQGLIAGQGIVLKINNGGLERVGLESSLSALWLSGVAGNAGTAVVVGQAGSIRRISLSATDGKSSQRKATAP
jgi:photosystem II stability/assembly factor-like uncharacterized protein